MAAQQQLAVQVSLVAARGHVEGVESVAKLLLSLPTLSVASGSDGDDGDENAAAIVTGVADKKQQLAVACLLHWALNCPSASSSSIGDATGAASASLEGAVVSVRCVRSHLVHAGAS